MRDIWISHLRSFTILYKEESNVDSIEFIKPTSSALSIHLSKLDVATSSRLLIPTAPKFNNPAGKRCRFSRGSAPQILLPDYAQACYFALTRNSSTSRYVDPRWRGGSKPHKRLSTYIDPSKATERWLTHAGNRRRRREHERGTRGEDAKDRPSRFLFANGKRFASRVSRKDI